MGTRYVQHKKTAGFYRVLTTGRLEATLEECVVYQNIHNNDVWVRPTKEFEDGRFRDVPVEHVRARGWPV
jgi:hypothetical protein